MENSNNTTKIIGALLLGGVIGGILGLLFAPAKGSDMRKKISSKGNDLTDVMKDKFTDLMHKVEEEVGMIKEKTAELIGNENPKG
jgi:gas vesicle protein